MATYKTVIRKSTVGAVIGDAFSEVETLAEEMREWSDNMESGNLGHTEKAERVSECADGLENVNIAEDCPESVAELEVEYGEQVPTRKGYNVSRSVRAGNAASMLEAAAGRLAEWFDENEEHEDAEDVQQLEQNCKEAADELQGLDFPGMFG